MKEAYFAGGCFWCVTPIYKMYGVDKVICGYAGGDEPNPTYEQVKHQETGHRETIKLVYDPEKVGFEKLLDIYFANVDPFDAEGQFIDKGFSYTLAIFYNSEEEKKAAEAKIAAIEKEKGKKVQVAVLPYKNFYEAEEYHQDYYLKNPEAFEKELVESGRKKKPDVKEKAPDRDKVIIRTSIIGILANVLLAAFKAFIGIKSNSIAVVLDAVNNLSDALSSIITIVGTKLSGRLPDKKHPLGYGRIEYLSAMIVSGIVLYAGITSAVESVKKIISPQKPDYSIVSLVIIAVAVGVKIVLGRYVKSMGEKVNSGSLIASGSDALFDAILSSSVLASAVIFMFSGISLEAFVGAVISVIIIKSGVEMMMETLNEILGMRADKETTDRIKALLSEEEEVRGAYDLIMYNYGPDKNYASVHIELPDTMTVKEVDRLTRKLEKKVYKQTGTILAGVGLYSYNTGDDEAARIRNEVCKIVLSHDWAIQLHGFYVDIEAKEMSFDVVVSFDIQPRDGVKILYEDMNKAFPEYTVTISPDIDVSTTD